MNRVRATVGFFFRCTQGGRAVLRGARVGAFAVAAMSLAALLACGGCNSDGKGPGIRCPGRETVAAAAAVFAQRRANLASVQAGGNCYIQWLDEKGGTHDENPAIELRFCPPERLFLRGDVLGNEALRLGCNGDEFWLRIKPKEVSTYWYGDYARLKRCAEALWFSPAGLMEALGVIEIGADYTLVYQDGMDVLVQLSPSGEVRKKVFVDCCTYEARRIEYYADDGKARMVMQLSDYQPVEAGVPVPSQIEVEMLDRPGTMVRLNLQKVRRFTPTPQQLEGKLFARPETTGFENVYRLDENCDFAKETP